MAKKPTNITIGWSYAFNMPYFTMNECIMTLHISLESYTKVCNVRFSGSAYPWISLLTASNYNIPPHGTDRWWAAAPIKGKGKGKIIINTSPRMLGRWAELYPEKEKALEVLKGLWKHELWHLLGYTTSQVYNEARLVKLWGAPTQRSITYVNFIPEASGIWALIRMLGQNPFLKINPTDTVIPDNG